jgi:Cd2+/Zn2+-exporting ATPase
MNNIFKKYHLGKLAYILLVLLLSIVSFFSDLKIMQYIALLSVWAPIFLRGIKDLKEKKFGSELFFIFASVIAVLGGEIQAITIVLIVVLIANYIEKLIEERMERAIESLMNLAPKDVIVRIDGSEKTISADKVSMNDLIVIKTGYRIPVDGLVIEGEAGVNESSLTGESDLKEKIINDLVYAGTFVESGYVVVKTQKVGQDTMFGRMQKLINEAGQKKAKIERITDKLAVPLTIGLTGLIAMAWFVTKDIQLIITLLVFGSPIELALITPLTVLSGMIAGFRNGVLIKGGISLEKMASIDVMVFDKTGTLTIGEPEIEGIKSYDQNLSEKDILKLSAIAEKHSGHVLSKAVMKKAKEENIEVPDPDDYNSVSGHGIEMKFEDKTYYLGNSHFTEGEKHGNVKLNGAQKADGKDGLSTIFYLSCDGKLCGSIKVADKIRDNAKTTVEKLKARGIKKAVLLSGDRRETVDRMAGTIGMNEAYGEMLPEQKFDIIKKKQDDGLKVAMIGDGINDALSLKQADVGIAMGAMGMEPAIEASDIALMSNSIEKIDYVYGLSQETMRKIKQNIFLGLGLTHGLGMILAFLHILNPVQAAFFHAVPDLLILFNSASLVKYK